MPELPEVETVVRGLRSTIMGKTITGVAVRYTAKQGMLRTTYQALCDGILNQDVQTVLRRGKYIILPLSNNNALVFHLGMTGRLLVSEVGEEDLYSRQPHLDDDLPHCHFIMELADMEGNPDGEDPDLELAFCDPRRFGKIWLVEDVEDIENLDVPGLKNLGPDALSISLADFTALAANGKRSVKSMLLDQTKLAGVGNIYADEACFVSKVHPGRSTVGLNKIEAAKLWFAVKTVLKEGIHFGGSSVSDYTSIDGVKGSYQQKHRVYGKQGEACVDCTTPIQRTKVVGRSTHFCPSCQKLEK